ncbi:hypothetical protein AB0L63_15310 [Nocardia sp. NPDC051990]|uniref:hypothetical protein n=1 Tax=Nocardia sp. NPDC051990 TaxID=3155285 RepID=UPI003439E7B1
MTAAFDEMNSRDLVGLLAEEEQQDLRLVGLRVSGSNRLRRLPRGAIQRRRSK